MASFDDDDSQQGFSDNENDHDETMEDAEDGDADNAGDGTTMMEEDREENEADDDGDDNQDSYEGTPARAGHANGDGKAGSDGRRDSATDDRTRDYKTPEPRQSASHTASPLAPRAKPVLAGVRQDMIDAVTYDIVPTIAAPHSTSINAITSTPDMRWVFSGGTDGWIRKFHWIDTVNNKAALTVAQKHPFVDSVVKAGVLMSYWENEEPSDEKPTSNTPKPPEEALPLSPVYSLAVHPQALWLLSGTEVGAINLQSVRHEEGKRITSLYQHSSAVSVMSLLSDTRTLISGSWDKTILEWDLNVGSVKRSYNGSRGQISALEFRPQSSIPVPRDTMEAPMLHRSADALGSGKSDDHGQGVNGGGSTEKIPESAISNKSPGGSLFEDNADNASLFGETEAPSNGAMAFEDDDEFSRLIAQGAKQQESLDIDGDNDTSGIQDSSTQPGPQPQDASNDLEAATTTADGTSNGAHVVDSEPALPPAHGSTAQPNGTSTSPTITDDANTTPQNETVFMDAAHDGTLRVWDRRQPNPIARMLPPRTVPPWCMHACWSPDGNHIYAGRRNGTVDEYSVHRGLKEPVRSLRFPGGSGAVSALRAMPNGKHLVCASFDILRLYDLQDSESAKHAKVPFLIVPGHRTGVVSQLFLDPTCSFMISTGGNRGWDGATTEVLLGYEIGLPR